MSGIPNASGNTNISGNTKLFGNQDPSCWTISDQTLVPTSHYLEALCTFCASYNTADSLFLFRFSSGTSSVTIHESRLLHAGGPLAAIVARQFAEREDRTVTLCQEDDSNTFNILRQSLYGCRINLRNVSPTSLVRIAKSAHRWQLRDIFKELCTFVTKQDLINDTNALVNAASLLSLDGLPLDFRTYFWRKASLFFRELAEVPTDKNSSDGDGKVLKVRECPGFPQIWDLLLSHIEYFIFPMPRRIIEDMIRNFDKEPRNTYHMKGQLLDLVLSYFEPRIRINDKLLEILNEIGPDSIREQYFLNDNDASNKVFSQRAMRLLAKSLLVPYKWRQKLSFSWVSCFWREGTYCANFLDAPPHVKNNANSDVSASNNTTDATSSVPSTPSPTKKATLDTESNLSSRETVGIQLQVDVSTSADGGIPLKIIWVAGQSVTKLHRTMEISLKVFNNCLCLCTDRTNEYLYEKDWTCALRNAQGDLEGSITDKIPTQEVSKMKKGHNVGTCRATGVLAVRLLHDVMSF